MTTTVHLGDCIAIEREADYIPLIMARIERNTI